ncbi:MAG: matrixin family metalloprotease [Nitrosarchaeum sp.]|nr:matrixin family metalloprotease [Nitrosarchaeum sp.]
MIILTNLSNSDGYSAYTNSIVDEVNHQILKSTITIYNIDKISLEDLKTLVRHELGHGFGLAHSTATEDLMAPVITTDYPYISECDLDAIHHLYNGGGIKRGHM